MRKSWVTDLLQLKLGGQHTQLLHLLVKEKRLLRRQNRTQGFRTL